MDKWASLDGVDHSLMDCVGNDLLRVDFVVLELHVEEVPPMLLLLQLQKMVTLVVLAVLVVVLTLVILAVVSVVEPISVCVVSLEAFVALLH